MNRPHSRAGPKARARVWGRHRAKRDGWGPILLEKYARDSKILDIFEGTQQIQMLIISRLLLGKTSADLR